jgi:hypothetical protein
MKDGCLMNASSRNEESEYAYVISQEQLDQRNEFRFGPERQICERFISGVSEIVQTEFFGFHICGDVDSQSFA